MLRTKLSEHKLSKVSNQLAENSDGSTFKLSEDSDGDAQVRPRTPTHPLRPHTFTLR